MADLMVTVVSADAELWTGAARMVVAKTQEGEVGILAGHQPLLAILASGEVRVTTPEGAVVTAQAADGFLSFEHDTVTIVARDAALTAS